MFPRTSGSFRLERMILINEVLGSSSASGIIAPLIRGFGVSVTGIGQVNRFQIKLALHLGKFRRTDYIQLAPRPRLHVLVPDMCWPRAKFTLCPDIKSSTLTLSVHQEVPPPLHLPPLHLGDLHQGQSQGRQDRHRGQEDQVQGSAGKARRRPHRNRDLQHLPEAARDLPGGAGW